MKAVKAVNTMFGCEIEFPVIKPLIEILNNNGNINILRYCISFTQEFRVLMKSLNSTDKKLRQYLMRLVLEDFFNRLEYSALEDPEKSHMRNLITGIHNQKLRFL